MKLNEHALANAHAVLAFALFLICVLLVAVLPGSTRWLFDTWFHGVSISTLPMETGPLSVILVGLLTFTAAAWLWGYLLALAYNRFTK